MRRAHQLTAMLAVIAALAILALAAGCGGSSSGSSSGSGASSSPQAKAYKIGITQIVTHPALDAAVAGFKLGLAEKGFTNVSYDMQNAEGDMSTTAPDRPEVRQREPGPRFSAWPRRPRRPW